MYIHVGVTNFVMNEAKVFFFNGMEENFLK